MPTIIPTSAAEHLGNLLTKESNLNVVFPNKNKDGKRHFPDGETYAKIPSASSLKGRIIVLHSGQPDPNRGINELEMILNILRDAGKKDTEIFFTYFPYCQQDKAFQNGETNAAENLLKKLTLYYKVRRIYALDAHFYGKQWIGKYPFVNISAVDLLRQAVEKDFSDIAYTSPDAGSQRRTGIDGVKKKRIHSYKTETQCDEDFRKKVHGKVVAVVDDILETGGTLDLFYDECIKCKPKAIVTLITHGALAQGVERIRTKYDKLYLTNSIRCEDDCVDITPLIINAIK